MADLIENLKEFTNTTIFLVRGIGHSSGDLRKYGFLNAYLDDVSHEPHYTESIYLLFKPADIEDFSYFLDTEQQRTSLLIEDYDYDGGYIVLVYRFPEQYLHEYNLFLNGQYSYFRKTYTSMFQEEVEIKNKFAIVVKKSKSIHYHVFNKTKELKEMWEERIGQPIPDDGEYWPIVDMNKEILDIEKIKQLELVSNG